VKSGNIDEIADHYDNSAHKLQSACLHGVVIASYSVVGRTCTRCFCGNATVSEILNLEKSICAEMTFQGHPHAVITDVANRKLWSDLYVVYSNCITVLNRIGNITVNRSEIANFPYQPPYKKIMRIFSRFLQ